MLNRINVSKDIENHKVPKLVFWFDNTPRVEAGSFNYVAKKWKNDVYYFCMDKLPEHRKKIGWVEESNIFVKYYYFSDIDNPKVFLNEFVRQNPDTIHIFNGFRSKTSKYMRQYINIVKTPKIILWSERPGVYGNTLKKASKQLFLKITYTLLYYKYRKYISALLPLGKSGVETFSRFGWDRNMMFPFMYNPDFQNHHTYADKSDSSHPIKFLYIGRFSKSTKGIDLLMSAFDNLKVGNWELSLVGGYGDYKDETIEWCNKNDNIEFIGSWKSNLVPQLMKDYDVVIVPSRFDGWNVVVNESIRAGIGAIVSNQAVSDELIENGGSGLVYKYDDVLELTDALTIVIEQPEIINIWKKNSHTYYEKISSESVGKYLIGIIEYTFLNNDLPRPTTPWLN